MSYSSYTDYLKYKNCKRDTVSCNNNFESYHKYTRSLACCRAWWTNDDMRKYNATVPCNMCLPPPKICLEDCSGNMYNNNCVSGAILDASCNLVICNPVSEES